MQRCTVNKALQVSCVVQWFPNPHGLGVFRDLARCHSNGTVSWPKTQEAATQRAFSRGGNPVSDKLGRIWRSHDGLHVSCNIHANMDDLRSAISAFVRSSVLQSRSRGDAMRCDAMQHVEPAFAGNSLDWSMAVEYRQSGRRHASTPRRTHTHESRYNAHTQHKQIRWLAWPQQRSGKGFIRLS